MVIEFLGIPRERAGISEIELEAATLGEVPVPLVSVGGHAAAILDGPRPFRIALTWGSATSASPGRASLTLPVPIAGSASLALDLPGRPADVRIAPGALTRTAVGGDITRIEATLVPGAATTVIFTLDSEALALWDNDMK